MLDFQENSVSQHERGELFHHFLDPNVQTATRGMTTFNPLMTKAQHTFWDYKIGKLGH